MPMVAVPNRLLLLVAKKSLLLLIVIVSSYFFVTTLMTGIFSSSSSNDSPQPSTSSLVNDGSVKKNIIQSPYKGVKISKKEGIGNRKKQEKGLVVINEPDETIINATTDDEDAETSSNSNHVNNFFPGTQLLNLMGGNDGKQNFNGEPLNDSNEGPMDRSYRDKPDKSLTLPPDKAVNFINKQKNSKRLRHKTDGGGENSSKSLPICPEPSPNLTGKIKQAVLLMTTLKESEINHGLNVGGEWKPKHCISRNKVAIIVPFRDRQSHLNRLIEFLIPMLQRQLLDFRFIVTEQYGHDLFNKGRIMNAAFEVAEYLGVDCVLFHDVDMFPQDDRNFYGCPNEPRHIGAFVNTLGYELWYDYIVGGVLAIQIDHYKQINGYSNMYWAWGGEDDDMGYRILANNFTIERPDPLLGRMTMLKHLKRSRTAPSLIHELLKTAQVRWVTDGLNDTQWKTIKIIKKPLYYHLYVDVGTPPNEWRQEKATTTIPSKKAH